MGKAKPTSRAMSAAAHGQRPPASRGLGAGVAKFGRKLLGRLTGLLTSIQSLSLSRLWNGAGQAWKALTRLAFNLVGVAIALAILVLSIEVFTDHTIAISPLPVPQALEDDGNTAEVAARRLRDALKRYAEHTTTRLTSPGLALKGDLPDFVVPTIGLSLGETVSHIRTYFRVPDRRNISGEITAAGNQIRLRLRLNGRAFYDSPDGVDPKHLDDLFADAAGKVFEVTQPYFSAAALAHDDPMRAIELAEHVIADCPQVGASLNCPDAQKKDVAWAHNLIGTIYFRKHRSRESIGEFQKAIGVDPEFAIAHSNWAGELRDLGEIDKAIAEYRKAIALDPGLAAAHNGLGGALRAQGKTEEAQREVDKANDEYRRATRVDPLSTNALIDFGNALKEQGRMTEAIARFRRALEVDARHPVAHYHLGVALRDQSEALEDRSRKADLLGQAIDEFRRTVALDTHYPDVHYDLGNALRRRGSLDEADGEYQKAIAEYRSAIEQDRRDATAHNKLGRLLHETGQRTAAIAEYSHAIDVDGDYSIAHANRGVTYFEAADYQAAASDLSYHVERYPNDPYYVLWLYLARAKSGDSDAAGKLRTNAAKLKRAWPYAVVELYLDPTKLEATRKAAEGNAAYLCEAQFYVGEWQLLQGDRGAAAEALKAATDSCQQEFIEYWGAKAELERLPQSVASP